MTPPAHGPHLAELRLPGGENVIVTGFPTAATATWFGWAIARAVQDLIGARRIPMTIRPEQDTA
jgi:hypothetical protein